jgi:hypothetical protein
LHTKETFAARVFNEGGNTSGDYVFNGTHQGQTDSSGDLLYDSNSYFVVSGDEWTTKGGGTYYNSVAGLSLSPSNFDTIYHLCVDTNNYTELDRPASFKVDTLLVDRGDYLMARRIVETPKLEGMPGGQLNDINPYAGLADIIQWAYLTDSAFYVGKRQSENLQFHERMRPSIDTFMDHNNRNVKSSYLERYGVLVKARTWCRGGGSLS